MARELLASNINNIKAANLATSSFDYCVATFIFPPQGDSSFFLFLPLSYTQKACHSVLEPTALLQIFS